MTNWSNLRAELQLKHRESVLPSNVKLPVLPKVVMEFSQKSKQVNVSPKELGLLLETDAGLSCELLRYVNSSAIGLRNKVSTAQQAITLMGISSARLFLTTIALQRALSSAESSLINLQAFWNTNLERALFAREVAHLLDADADLAFAASMLQDFLLPVLTKEMTEQYLGFHQIQQKVSVSLPEYENELLGWDHCLAAGQLMTEWGFPDELVCCVMLHHKGIRLLGDEKLGMTAAAACAVAAMIPDPFHQVPGGLESLMKLDAAWPRFSLMEIAERVQHDFQELSSGSANHISLLSRCERTLQAVA